MTSKTQKPQIASKGPSITSNIPKCGLHWETLSVVGPIEKGQFRWDTVGTEKVLLY